MSISDEEYDAVTELRKEINKNHKSNIIIPASDIIEEEKKIVSVSPMVDYHLGGGIPEGTWLILSGLPKCGKMQPFSSRIYKPTGYTTMGNIKLGDTILGINGQTTVTGVFDNGKQPVYKVIFDSGDYVRCGLEHLWEVKCRYNKKIKIKTTKELINDLHEYEDRPKWSIELPKSDFLPCEVPIHPYLLGALLGDGSLTGKDSIKFTTADKQMLDMLNWLLKYDYYFKPCSKKENEINYRMYCHREHNKYIDKLKELDLHGCSSHTKFVPNCYKYNSRKVRLDILRGLLDTDGTISKRGHVLFTSTSKQLANDVREIVLSLGGIARYASRYTTCNGKKFKSYRCYIRYDNKKELFCLKRKKDRCQPRIKKPLTRKISNIIFDGYEECRCIQVDDSRGLYITDNYIVTHNTTCALQIAANSQQQWHKPVYIGSVEHRINKKELEGIHGLQIDKVEMIQSTSGKILTAQDFLQEFTTIIKSIPGCVLIIDSTSALCAEGEFASIMNEKSMGRNEGPKLLAQFCRKMTGVVPVQNTIVIVIQHLIANTSGYGEPYYEDGGRKMQHQADTKLRCTSFQKWENAKKEQIGQVINWQVKTAALTKPGGKFKSYLRYGYGFDDIQELILLGCDMGLIKKASTWYSLCGEKVQGEEKLRQLLVDSPDILNQLKLDIEKML